MRTLLTLSFIAITVKKKHNNILVGCIYSTGSGTEMEYIYQTIEMLWWELRVERSTLTLKCILILYYYTTFKMKKKKIRTIILWIQIQTLTVYQKLIACPAWKLHAMYDLLSLIAIIVVTTAIGKGVQRLCLQYRHWYWKWSTYTSYRGDIYHNI